MTSEEAELNYLVPCHARGSAAGPAPAGSPPAPPPRAGAGSQRQAEVHGRVPSCTDPSRGDGRGQTYSFVSRKAGGRHPRPMRWR